MRDGEYERVKAAFVALYSTQIRNVQVSIGQLREGGQITQNMVLVVERTDYDPGAQFICLRLSTVRKIGQWIARHKWEVARRLTPLERNRLDSNHAPLS